MLMRLLVKRTILCLSRSFQTSSLSSAASLLHQTPHYPQKEEEEEAGGGADDSFSSFEAREQQLVSLFKPCSIMRDLAQVHARIIRTGFDQHVFVVGRVISFCAVSDHGSMDHALRLFRHLNFPDAFVWNTMIRGFGRTGRTEEAFLFFTGMRQHGKIPDSFTFSFLLKISGDLAVAELGRQLHCCVLRHGLGSHVFVCNTLVHMYGVLKDLESAGKVFDEMPKRDVVSWNALIDGYANSGECEEALRMFLRMQKSGFAGDDATVVVTLSACSELGVLEFGRWVHSHAISSSMLEQFVSVANSLVDMYAKCGAIDQAFEVFQGMKERNVVSWNSMILGLAMHGHAVRALELFDEMRETELEEPNDITFLGVLCACAHAGLVGEARKYLDSMRSDYGINPTVKHYGCMIDLLGRAGLVSEAYELIKGMPMDGKAVMWRTLLAACRVHGDIKLGERVRRHLEELEDHSSDYVLLSHIYASNGQWNKVLGIREAMKGRGVWKPEPGNSSVNSLPRNCALQCFN